jgi:DNA-binding CsgD family transcriptional regulator
MPDITPPAHRHGHAVLTEREIEILTLVAGGQTSAVIARHLQIAPSTVKSHLTSVYKKTGARNRVQATRYFLDHYAASAGADAPYDTA